MFLSKASAKLLPAVMSAASIQVVRQKELILINGGLSGTLTELTFVNGLLSGTFRVITLPWWSIMSFFWVLIDVRVGVPGQVLADLKSVQVGANLLPRLEATPAFMVSENTGCGSRL